MSADEKGQTETPERSEEGEEETPDQSEEGKEFELSDEGKQEVQRMQDAYDDDRETVGLPGTDNTITGVAINEWLDDDGNPKFGKDEQQNDKNEQQNDKGEQQNGKDEQQNDAD
jgi:hypothetical protein